jgi:hypothetical protein
VLENLPDPDHPGAAEGLQDYFPAEGVDKYRR